MFALGCEEFIYVGPYPQNTNTPGKGSATLIVISLTKLDVIKTVKHNLPMKLPQFSRHTVYIINAP